MLARSPFRPALPVLARDPDAAATTPEEAYEYQTSMDAKEKFMAGSFSKENVAPSTGIGRFDAVYLPGGGMTVRLKVKFDFQDGAVTDYPGTRADDLKWKDTERESFRGNFLSQVRAKWTDKFTFYAQRDWWEELAAAVTVEVMESDDSPHFDITVTKVPVGKNRPYVNSNTPMQTLFGRPGSAQLYYGDDQETNNGEGKQHHTVHEAGHMFGMKDEYPEEASDEGQEAGHSELSKKAGLGPVVKHRDGRIMSTGEDIGKGDSVTFLETINDMAGDANWGLDKKSPRPKPADPDSPSTGGGGGPDAGGGNGGGGNDGAGGAGSS